MTEDRPLPWNPDGGGLRAGRSDKPFDILAPAEGEAKLPPEDALPAGATPAQQTSNSPDGGLGILEDVIISFNGTAFYCNLNGRTTGPV